MSGKYSRHNVAYHTSHVSVAETIPSHSLIEKASKVLNGASRIVILVGQGALESEDQVLAVAERLEAPVVKALLGKAVIQTGATGRKDYLVQSDYQAQRDHQDQLDHKDRKVLKARLVLPEHRDLKENLERHVHTLRY